MKESVQNFSVYISQSMYYVQLTFIVIKALSEVFWFFVLLNWQRRILGSSRQLSPRPPSVLHVSTVMHGLHFRYSNISLTATADHALFTSMRCVMITRESCEGYRQARPLTRQSAIDTARRILFYSI